MRNIIHISDETLGLAPDTTDEVTFAKREAARGIVFNQLRQIALLYSERDDYHKLPGGGIEAGEDWQLAFQREALEEIGCETSIRPIEMGTVTESRAEHQLLQTSYCCIADVIGDIGEPKFTTDEIEVGLTPKWVALQDAIKLVNADRPKSYAGKFIQVRDLAFLREAMHIELQKISTKPKELRIKDKSLIEAFFHDHKIAEMLNIPPKDGLETFFNCIYIEILDGHNPQRAAEETLRLMEGKAASHAAKTNNYDYQLVNELEDQLADIITKTIALEAST